MNVLMLSLIKMYWRHSKYFLWRLCLLFSLAPSSRLKLTYWIVSELFYSSHGIDSHHVQYQNHGFVSIWVFTRGQYWPSGIVVACVCVYVCLSVNHEFVRAIIHQPFKLGSPNLDQRCKRPWLRSLLFCGVIDGDLQGQIELESQNLPHFWLVSLSGR